MKKAKKRIIDVNHKEARKFFLDEDAYTTIDLPQYFSFSKIISDISDELIANNLSLKEICKAKDSEEVNHILFSNKDGKYAWRKLQIINPILYVWLVHKITEKNNWELIVKRLKTLQLIPSIKCSSIPMYATNIESQRGEQINSWLQNVEEESIKLALDFEYLFHTDITDCYGSIYTHSIPWALHTKSVSKQDRNSESLIGNTIDHVLQSMSYGQTNGIPQGSILMDFLAEFILAYVDKNLANSIAKLRIKDDEYRIIRYRDDYRIFTKDPKHGEEILKVLSEELATVGMKLHPVKTTIANNIISGSIKPEKLHYLQFPLPNKLKPHDLRKQLLIVLQVNEIYPNSLATAKRLTDILNLWSGKYYKSVEAISILVNIGIESPAATSVVAAFISHLIKYLDQAERLAISKKIMRKIDLLPNSGLLEIWLQRILIKLDFKNSYSEKLCLLAEGKQTMLFNEDWLQSKKLKKLLKQKVYNEKIVKSLDKVISKKEIELFKNQYSS